jgi:hypothetical protein
MARPKRPYKCRLCSGTGYSACRTCGGSGKRGVSKRSGRFRGHAAKDGKQPEVQYESCTTCNGSGRGRRCHQCDGTGKRTS